MSKYTARYLVQRGDQQYICRGDKLFSRLRNNDLLAVQRGDTLYHSRKDKLRDGDWLVCMDGSVAKRISGSAFIPLLLQPPTITPITIKVSGEVYTPNSILEVGPGVMLTFEVELNPATNNLSKKYEWIIRSGNGRFTSSPNARAVTYTTGNSGSENINCNIEAIGADPSRVSTELIQMFVLP